MFKSFLDNSLFNLYELLLSCVLYDTIIGNAKKCAQCVYITK